MNSPRGKGKKREKGISSFGHHPRLALPPVFPPRASPNLHSGFISPPPSLLPLASPTMIQPLLIALPHYCPTFMALSHYHPVRPPTPSPAGRHPPADVTYHVRRRAGETYGDTSFLPYGEKGSLLQVRRKRRRRTVARLPRGCRGRRRERVTPNLGGGGGLRSLGS